MVDFIGFDVSKTMARVHLDRFHGKISNLPGIKLKDPKKFHITLLYLGESNDDLVEERATALSRVRFRPIQLSLEDVGFFPAEGDKYVVYVGVRMDGGKRKLLKLYHSVKKTLKFEDDQKYGFIPHVTIARSVDKAPIPEDICYHIGNRSPRYFGKVDVMKLHLYRSGKDGYEILG
jgi:2'-5' RNA ligase